MSFMDMTFCVDNDCPSKEKCFRHWKNAPKTEANIPMSMADFSNIRENQDQCENFLPVERRTQVLHG